MRTKKSVSGWRTVGPDVAMCGGTVLASVARRVRDNTDEAGWFDCRCDIEDGDINHYFHLAGRLEFATGEGSGRYCRGVWFRRVEATTESSDGGPLANDFTESLLEWFLKD